MRVVLVTGDEGARREALRDAAELLRAGRLVAFPTETVYGLGANALDPEAVQRIYDAKGRPAINPLIVHVFSTQDARDLALEWTREADALARAFWPGPITLVVRKAAVIPDIVSAGTDSVGLRVPAHPIALALLKEVRLPIAAPSANLSTQVSPTTAQHVVRGLGDRVDLVLDGGPTTVGIESTVVDLTGALPRILRPGMIARDAIARVAGAAEIGAPPAAGDAARSPGVIGKHYAPRAAVRLLSRDALVQAIHDRHGHQRVGAMVFMRVDAAVVKEMPSDPESYARELYAAMHALDEAGCDVVLIERPPGSAAWAAIADRLERAAT